MSRPYIEIATVEADPGKAVAGHAFRYPYATRRLTETCDVRTIVAA